ncbi:Spiroplasmavirus-related protein [Spiroplasma kunkelii CR2-3x]|uniref:Spiroplasmavirus-related protein n=1 Tax=Spiroplasma kunkelii CR2-3x TaxID=273035 RepID=A0A0K2JFK1_SPIKU|nr:Spiroplasmavirus-related protein [Spiroplasma kunkelii CR2-3x]
MYSYLSFIDKVKLEQLLLSKIFLKKNGKHNISTIAKYLNRHRSTIYGKLRSLKILINIVLISQIICIIRKEKRKKRNIFFTEEQLNFIKIRFNKYRDTPEQLIYRYFLKFSVKFPACVKTFYKWVRLGKFVLKKENLRYRGKKFKTKGKKDNRGKLTDFKSIWNIENKVSNVGWFEMDTVIGKYRQSSNLVLV